ncbi:Tetratricopeptide repeat protein 29 [Cladochytrium tenue]|nr:Tetratricopeptide repeat protein 29 [Cladochytrium tenue]
MSTTPGPDDTAVIHTPAGGGSVLPDIGQRPAVGAVAPAAAATAGTPQSRKKPAKQRSRALPAKRTPHGPLRPIVATEPGGDAAGDPDASAKLELSPQAVCIELLVEGHVRSYVDFFNLAVRDAAQSGPAPTAAAAAAAADPQPQGRRPLAEDELRTLRTLLTRCEDTQRAGDAAAAYTARRDCAVFFMELGDGDLAKRYLREALASAKTLGDAKLAEVEAAFELGRALEASGELPEALLYFDSSRNLAMDHNAKELEAMASTHAVVCRLRIADMLEVRQNFKDAIKLYTQGIEVLTASTTEDRLLNEIFFRLGNAHKQQGNIDTAIECLQQYLSKCEEMHDQINAGRARTALAACYESSSRTAEAAESLEQFVAAAGDDPAQLHSVAVAYKQLGALYGKLGDQAGAVACFDRHFRLAVELAGNPRAAAQPPPAPAAAVASDRIVENGRAAAPAAVALVAAPAVPAAHDGMAVIQRAAGVAGIGGTGGGALSAARVQLGLSRGSAGMTQFFGCAASGDATRTAALLAWKARREPLELLAAAGAAPVQHPDGATTSTEAYEPGAPPLEAEAEENADAAAQVLEETAAQLGAADEQ